MAKKHGYADSKKDKKDRLDSAFDMNAKDYPKKNKPKPKPKPKKNKSPKANSLLDKLYKGK